MNNPDNHMKVGDLVLDIGTREHVLIISERPSYHCESGETHTWDFEVLCPSKPPVIYYADSDELEVINESQ